MQDYAWMIYTALAFVGVILLWSLWGYPHWRVWASHQEGLADLTRARNEQQIQVAQAESRLAAAEANKKAAIVEAEAVAEQIKAIGTQLTEHDLYLRWQWIKMMEDTHKESSDGNSASTVIYVPTEANIPILEAQRLKPVAVEKAA